MSVYSIVLTLFFTQLSSGMTERFRKNWLGVRDSKISSKSGVLHPAWTGAVRTTTPGKSSLSPGKSPKAKSLMIPVISGKDIMKNIRMLQYGDIKGKKIYSVSKSLDSGKCLAVLKSLGIHYVTGPRKRGIRNPVTLLNKRINGVYYNWMWGNKKDFFMECHFALALYLAGPVFLKHGYDEVLYTSMYRYTYVSGTRRLSRHAAADAIDIMALRGKNGKIFVVERDWIRHYGDEKDCIGPLPAGEARNARSLICELEKYPIFRRILTPDADYAHRNHFHVSGPQPGEKWYRGRYAGRSKRARLSTYTHKKILRYPLPRRPGDLNPSSGKKNVSKNSDKNNVEKLPPVEDVQKD
ncbi:MAG: extensin family protein [Deltaproteobacteria bacterium]|nr:extensin family protein [Deltaproteobacteria bacterium]